MDDDLADADFARFELQAVLFDGIEDDSDGNVHYRAGELDQVVGESSGGDGGPPSDRESTDLGKGGAPTFRKNSSARGESGKLLRSGTRSPPKRL